jgi:hypothetical protein
MEKKKLLWGMLAAALVFGIVIAGCDDLLEKDEEDNGSNGAYTVTDKSLIIRDLNAEQAALGQSGIKIWLFPRGTSLEQALQQTGIIAGADSSQGSVTLQIYGDSASYLARAELYVPGTSNRWTGSGVGVGVDRPGGDRPGGDVYDVYLILGSDNYYRKQDVGFGGIYDFFGGGETWVSGADFLKLNEDGSELYTVTFSAGEGSGTPPESLTVAPGTVITLPGQGDMIPPEGMGFLDWSQRDSLGNYYSYSEGDEYTVSANSTFTARWDTARTVTFSPGEGSGTPPESLSVAWGTVITLPGQGSMIAPDRKSFAGWRGGSPSRTYSEGDSYTVPYIDSTFTAQWKSWVPQGVYIGVISFAGNVTAITYRQSYSSSYGNDSPLYYLNASGKTALSSRLFSSYKRASESGTALYYAVHKALSNLTEAEPVFSNDPIRSVYLITFTDGLDNASFGASNNAPIEGKTGVSSTNYAAYIREQFGSRTIGGVPITAYSIGVKGSDVTDENAFNTTLSSIASTDDNVYTLTSVNELKNQLEKIANAVNIESTINFEMVTTQNDPGTVIRMTFDVTGTDPADAAAAARYIDGTLAYDSAAKTWSLTNIQYSSGITSQSGTTIEGIAGGSTVSFTFKEITGYNPRTDTDKQWIKTPTSSSWQINSEYAGAGSTDTTVDMMLVYLVLDASTSLNDTQIMEIRTAVNSFIDTLYNRTQLTY